MLNFFFKIMGEMIIIINFSYKKKTIFNNDFFVKRGKTKKFASVATIFFFFFFFQSIFENLWLFEKTNLLKKLFMTMIEQLVCHKFLSPEFIYNYFSINI